MSCVSREKQDASSVESGSTQESPSRNLEGLQASRRAEWKTGKQAEPARHRPAPAPASPKHALARSSHRRQGQGLMWCCGKPRNLNGARKRFYVFHVFPAWRAPTRFSAGPNQHLCVTAPIKCRDFPIGRRCDGPGQSQRGPSRRVFQPMVAAGQSVPGRPATAKKEKKKNWPKLAGGAGGWLSQHQGQGHHHPLCPGTRRPAATGRWAGSISLGSYSPYLVFNVTVPSILAPDITLPASQPSGLSILMERAAPAKTST